MNKKRLIIISLCAALAVSLTGCKKEEEASAPEETNDEIQAQEFFYRGTLLPVRSAEVYADKTGQIELCEAEVGDSVIEGQLLYKLDENGLYDDIDAARNSLEKSRISLATAQKNVDDLKVYAPASGILKDFDVKAGERVNTQTVGIIVDEANFTARVPFTAAQLEGISVGSTAEVTCDDTMGTVSGIVKRIYSQRNSSVPGAELYDVEISGKNLGGLTVGMAVSAQVNGIQSPITGTITEGTTTAVVSRGSGYAHKVNYEEGDYVKRGALIIDIENVNTSSALERAEIDVDDSQRRLNSLLDDEKKLKIYSPMSGVVTQRKKGERDTIASKSDSIMTISDTSILRTDITVSDSEALAKLSEGENIGLDCGDYGKVSALITDIDSETGVVSLSVTNDIGIAPGTVAAISTNGGEWNE